MKGIIYFVKSHLKVVPKIRLMFLKSQYSIGSLEVDKVFMKTNHYPIVSVHVNSDPVQEITKV